MSIPRWIRCWNHYKYFKAAITKLLQQVIINPLEKKSSLKQPERKDSLSLGEHQLEWEWWHFLIWKCGDKRDSAQPISTTERKELIKCEFYVCKNVHCMPENCYFCLYLPWLCLYILTPSSFCVQIYLFFLRTPVIVDRAHPNQSLNILHLQRPYFQVKSHSEVSGRHKFGGTL